MRLRKTLGRGKACRGGNRERKSCNQTPCKSLEALKRDEDLTSIRRWTTKATQKPASRVTTKSTSRVKTTTKKDTVSRRTTKKPSPTSAEIGNQRQVKCFVCGSLFSSASESSDCSIFNVNDPKLQKTCKIGEACLHYSWKKADHDYCKLFSASFLFFVFF